MTYRQDVAEARRLVKRSEEDQWRLAELTWENVKPQGSRTQAEWAGDVGISQGYASKIIRVWSAYAVIPRNKRPRFADAYAEVGGMPVDRAERREAEAMSNLRKATPERRAEAVREFMQDPHVAREARQALAEQAHREAIESGGIDMSRADQQGETTQASHHLQVIELAAIVNSFGHWVENLAGLDPVAVHARDRDAVLKAVGAIEGECANVRAYFAGELIDPDEALREWSAS